MCDQASYFVQVTERAGGSVQLSRWVCVHATEHAGGSVLHSSLSASHTEATLISRACTHPRTCTCASTNMHAPTDMRVWAYALTS